MTTQVPYISSWELCQDMCGVDGLALHLPCVSHQRLYTDLVRVWYACGRFCDPVKILPHCVHAVLCACCAVLCCVHTCCVHAVCIHQGRATDVSDMTGQLWGI